jgi:hypothetical protein
LASSLVSGALRRKWRIFNWEIKSENYAKWSSARREIVVVEPRFRGCGEAGEEGTEGDYVEQRNKFLLPADYHEDALRFREQLGKVDLCCRRRRFSSSSSPLRVFAEKYYFPFLFRGRNTNVESTAEMCFRFSLLAVERREKKIMNDG